MNNIKQLLTTPLSLTSLQSAISSKTVIASTQPSDSPSESFLAFIRNWWNLRKTTALRKKRLRALCYAEINGKDGSRSQQALEVLSQCSSQPTLVYSNKFSEWAARSVFGLNMFGYACIAISGLWILGWYLDNKPPIVLKDYMVSPAYPGYTSFVVMNVERDLSRNCRATYSRRFIDSAGSSHAIESGTLLTAADIKAAELRNPGKALFAMEIPYGVPPGPGKIITPILYYCNPWHSIFNNPIEVSLEINVTVLQHGPKQGIS